MENCDDDDPVSETEVSSTKAKAVSNFELAIVSYGHSNGPLTLSGPGTVEQLTFSVRDIKNPPAKLRKTHTGLSSHLRKEVMANKAAAARLSFITEAVRAKMREMRLAREEVDTSTETPLYPTGPSILVVGIMCERGKHRSVAFAEELSRKIRADGCWIVSVQHRELSSLSDRQGGGIEDEHSLGGDGRAGHKHRRQRDLERKKGRSSAGRSVQEAVADAEEDA
ncbi:uncharacterized protein Z519_07260 [Cladophialophora bantiana CBS 173.52]|uniref:RapZ C-terminal domain-containing protein n=1 Tax=Cladophialophora bantiana (strain ATCC 10958 / CBS 173.52 / CDC B-1940 / NIH 8579) TaxID=1442370 RepID=A0A0D2EQQ4_CLAB1|nr:uncharacterized protein Z519_07260 [Cladophialophora bantiana CBS 173.52]KIW92276.1 hypothetical protein Z519_07260 [Cladophialophora bantiana CBS 173.52]